VKCNVHFWFIITHRLIGMSTIPPLGFLVGIALRSCQPLTPFFWQN